MKPIRAASVSGVCKRIGGEGHVEQEVPEVQAVAQGVEVVVDLEVCKVSEAGRPCQPQRIHGAACQLVALIKRCDGDQEGEAARHVVAGARVLAGR